MEGKKLVGDSVTVGLALALALDGDGGDGDDIDSGAEELGVVEVTLS